MILREVLQGQVFRRPVPPVDLAAGAGPFAELLRWRRRRQQELPGLEFRSPGGEAPVVSPALLPPNASIEERDEAVHFGFGFGFGLVGNESVAYYTLYVHSFLFAFYNQSPEMCGVYLVVMCLKLYFF